LKNQNSVNLELDVEVMFFVWSPKARRSASDTFAEIFKATNDFCGMKAIEKFVWAIAVEILTLHRKLCGHAGNHYLVGSEQA
jgi:hypothetical protein